ncbi:ATP-binding protein [Nostoc sp. DedQUE07]|uniref:ATP-binding protein n=1 Tax=Nostoc sp. DedQUE07 TaxID=3075392 RepID=UPI002AD36E78|nr:ATP-binding protein [Nostoc sp. DedQUE07]MDZ8132019.1 ATP-binding protein [Nostoc sp. DedQUE07]
MDEAVNFKIYHEWDWKALPNGGLVAIARYREHKHTEYNLNPLIQTLPEIISNQEFLNKVTLEPDLSDEEIIWEAHDRFHCVERLSDFYFEPLGKTVSLYRLVSTLIMRGYLHRNPLVSEYAKRSREINEAVQDGDGRNILKYISLRISASALTLIGPSGIGKSTDIKRILSLYPQVIVHPNYSIYQVVWVKVDCSPIGSLKGLCSDIFFALSRILKDEKYQKYAVPRNSVDYMLAELAQVANTINLGVLVIDEMQNLANTKTNENDILNYLVDLSNTIGVPIIRIGTPEAKPILMGNFRNARRGGECIEWHRLTRVTNKQDDSWKKTDFYYLITGLWLYQWTKTSVKFEKEFYDTFYNCSQGIIDITIKLYKMVQWKAIAIGGEEEITVELINNVAAEGLILVQPMLDAIRSGKQEDIEKYRDIALLDEYVTNYREKCISELIGRQQQEIRDSVRRQQGRESILPKVSAITAELLRTEKLGLDFHKAIEYAEKVVNSSKEDDDILTLIKNAQILALDGDSVKTSKSQESIQRKSSSKPATNKKRQAAKKTNKKQNLSENSQSDEGLETLNKFISDDITKIQ